MARKNNLPQKAAMLELMGNCLKQNNVKIKDGADINAIIRGMMSVILEVLRGILFGLGILSSILSEAV